jgi:hypothetical protein
MQATLWARDLPKNATDKRLGPGPAVAAPLAPGARGAPDQLLAIRATGSTELKVSPTVAAQPGSQ